MTPAISLAHLARLARLVGSVCFVAVSGCASASAHAAHANAQALTAAPPAVSARAAHRRPIAAERAPLASPSDSDTDCVFLANASRAVEQYRAFIRRAGNAQEYSAALTRSRDQITDLQAEMEFVHSGMAQRGAQCSAALSATASQGALE